MRESVDICHASCAGYTKTKSRAREEMQPSVEPVALVFNGDWSTQDMGRAQARSQSSRDRVTSLDGQHLQPRRHLLAGGNIVIVRDENGHSRCD